MFKLPAVIPIAAGSILGLVASTAFFAHGSLQAAVESANRATSAGAVHADPVYARTPAVALGVPITRLEASFGKPAEKARDSWNWELKNCGLRVKFDAEQRVASYVVTLNPNGSQLVTPDGVILGKDTFQQAEAKLKERLLPEKQDFGMEDGVWYLYVYARSASDPGTTSVYSAYLNEGIPEQAAIVATEKEPTAKIFAKVPVSQFGVEKVIGRH